MNSTEIRERFLHFFAEREHKVLPSSSLIPFDDPTVLLTTAGMLPFKPYFLGQTPPPHPRVTTVQKVFRTSDIEEVGRDGHHLTFFEMLGNFSFGNYFKERAIPYAFELLTKGFGLQANRLWAGIHDDDDESFQIWKATGIPPERIRRFGDEYNFWAAGPTGPCGPDSEVHYDTGDGPFAHPGCGPNHCDRFLEIWNLVFMQWDRDASGRRTPLKRRGIDTGMGLERLTAVVNGRKSAFDTDLFQPLIAFWAGARSNGSRPGVDASLRVLADHSRGSAMLLADGVVPSNEGRGYVLRRLIRRAMVHAHRIGAQGGLSSAVPVVDEILGGTYPELHLQTRRIAEALRAEEERFGVTLRQGMERLTELLQKGSISAEEVFRLYDERGFPIELTLELALERGLRVDRAAVDALMEGQRARSRGAAAFTVQAVKSATHFIGYERLQSDATVLEVFVVPDDPRLADVYLDVTPFYAERGGQAADRGRLRWNGHEALVLDVQVQGEAVRHRVRIEPGPLTPGTRVQAGVDPVRRAALARHHSATHLLHRALRDILGEEAVQAGSTVLPDYATFDFRFPRALTPAELDRVVTLLNQQIRANLPRRVEHLPLQEAVRSGAVALFDEKYGETVRVVSFGEWARELCGGTHVERSGEIGLALIGGDRSIGAGIRRIELRAGEAAEAQVHVNERTIARLMEMLKATPAELSGKVEALQAEIKRQEKDIVQLKQKLASGTSSRVEQARVRDVTLMLQRVDAGERDLLLYADHALDRANGHGVALIVGGQNFAVKVAAGLQGRLPAGDLVRAFTAAAGGKGGSRDPAVGQGGGIDPQRVEDGFKALQAWISTRLGSS